MAGSQTPPVLGVEVFKVDETVTPVRIALKLLHFPVKWSPTLVVPEKESSQSTLQI